MTDRELWVSVFNNALSSAVALMNNNKTLSLEGKTVSPGQWANSIATDALEEAPKEETK